MVEWSLSSSGAIAFYLFLEARKRGFGPGGVPEAWPADFISAEPFHPQRSTDNG